MLKIKKSDSRFSHRLKIFIFLTGLIFAFSIFNSVKAADSPALIDLNSYPWSNAKTPASFVAVLYQISLGLAAAAALGAMLYGAILYTVSGGNASRQDEARKYITGAIWGVVLLLGAYIILYTINPGLVKLTDPSLGKVDIPPANSNATVSTPPIKSDGTFEVAESAADVKLDQTFVRSMFFSAGIGTKSECQPGQTDGCVSLKGLRGATYNEVMELKKNSDAPIFVSGGTEEGHGVGVESHLSGYKVDIRNNPLLDKYIYDTFQKSGTRSDPVAQKYGQASASFQIYTNPKTGAQYVFESQLKDSNGKIIRHPHWDVLVK